MRVAGFVLVGGASSRMGRDKARLPIGSHLLVEVVAQRVQSVADNVTLIGRPDRYRDLGLVCLEDLRPGLGPLSGIETALAARSAELNLVVACDLAGLQTKWLATLIEAAGRTNALCVAARDRKGKVHPTCAVYRAACLPRVQRALDAGQLRLLELLPEFGTALVDIPETISNVNCPEDWERWRGVA